MLGGNTTLDAVTSVRLFLALFDLDVKKKFDFVCSPGSSSLVYTEGRIFPRSEPPIMTQASRIFLPSEPSKPDWMLAVTYMAPPSPIFLCLRTCEVRNL